MYKANYPNPPVLAGRNIGALRHRTYEASVIARNGGLLVDVETQNEENAIVKMMGMMERKEIDGFLLDRYTYLTVYYHMTHHTETDIRFADAINYLHAQTIQTEISYKGMEKMHLGMLVNNLEDYEYFKDYVKDNAIAINACSGLLLNYMTMNGGIDTHAVEHDALFATNSGLFWPSFITCVIVIVLMFCFGIVYEKYRPSYFKQHKQLNVNKSKAASSLMTWVHYP